MSGPVLPPLSGVARRYRRLRPGDRVAVVAPASPVRLDLLEEGLGRVRDLGFEPVTRPDVAASHRFTAGTDDRRLAELTWALSDRSVRAAWLARGGYGTLPLLPRLPAAALAADPKPIIGESDATALGCWALAQGIAWLHGPMVAASLRSGPSVHAHPGLAACLGGEGFPLVLQDPGVRTLRPGRARGVLWGGCLTLLAALAGTPWLRRPDRGVLAIEDTGVKPYQVHRMLVQLRLAGALEGLQGVILGDFSDCVQHAGQDYLTEDVLAELLGEVAPGAPVTSRWRFGHVSGPHLALPMGCAVALEAPADGAALLTIEQPPCDD